MSSFSLTRLLYNGVGYPALSIGAHVAAVFSSKLRSGLRGRYGLLDHARQFRQQNPHARVVLFHCASAGELEGVKPLASACIARGFTPCVTFFSPSAQTVLNDSEFAFADFSPFDSIGAVRAFLSALKPDAVMISKHDVWPNLVWQSRNLEIPIWLINGNFHEASLKTWPILRGVHKAIYSQLTGILTVSEPDAKRARGIVGPGCLVEPVGDSRFDRVWWRAQKGIAPFPHVDSNLQNRKIIVCGSTHDRDEELLLAGFSLLKSTHPTLQLLLVPHDPSDAALTRIQARADQYNFTHGEVDLGATTTDILIVNKKGVLADLYRYGRLAYVGGGFGRGVHSVIEPMAHGLKVLCGPKIDVSREANDAQSADLLRVVESSDQIIIGASAMLIDPDTSAVKNFVRSHCGTIDRILDFVLNTRGPART